MRYTHGLMAVLAVVLLTACGGAAPNRPRGTADRGATNQRFGRQKGRDRSLRAGGHEHGDLGGCHG